MRILSHFFFLIYLTFFKKQLEIVLMKKLLFLLTFWLGFFSFGFIGLSSANFEFETVRTEQAPGFFLVRIFPVDGTKPLPVQNIFVTNYASDESERYMDIVPLIQELGGLIITKDELGAYMADPLSRIVFLGEKEEGFLHFALDSSDKSVEQFEVFSEHFLSEIFLKDVQLDFGGNAVEILPSVLPDISKNSLLVVGKFREPMKTRMELRGVTADGEIRAVEPLYLQDKALSSPLASQSLPELWEELWLAEQGKKTGKSFMNFFSLGNVFPVILFLLGVLCFWWFWYRLRQGSEIIEMSEAVVKATEDSPKAPLEEVPFEIERRRHSPTETKSRNVPFSLVAGNTRTQPSDQTGTKNTPSPNPSSKAQR